MLLSYRSRSTFKSSRDFEEWLSDDPSGDGASNGFTAYDKVCFHFTCSPLRLGEALERFAGLFRAEDVVEICRDGAALKREVRRVDAELDLDDVSTQAYYLLKAFCTPEHPFSRFSAGSLETLEKNPRNVGTNVEEWLISLFQNRYLPSQAVLVVVAPLELFTLERFVTPFASTLSRYKPTATAAGATVEARSIPPFQTTYPGGLLQGKRLKHMVLYRKQPVGDGLISSELERLYIDWSLHLDYQGENLKSQSVARPLVTATHVAFILSQILGRKGPGSLYAFLVRRGWTRPGATGVPRVLVPLDVSGFQILRLDIALTIEGFINRSAVVAAVYDAIGAAQASATLTTALLAQYATVAQLHAYNLAQRPPDAVELAVDALFYGLSPDSGVSSGQWYRFPSPLYRSGLETLRRITISAINQISEYENAVIIVTAGNRALDVSSSAFEEKLPPLSSPRWLTEPVSGARFCFVDMLPLPSRLEELVLTKIIDSEELLPPVLNPLAPASVRKPRLGSALGALTDRLNEKVVYPMVMEGSSAFRRSASPYSDGGVVWRVLLPIVYQTGLPMPRGPPEATCQCAFVLQLLSSRPARATVRQAAHAELWKLSFEDAVSDLAEFGAPGGLAYDVSFNKYGLRLAFLGISQTIPSYVRRLCRRFVEHPYRLLEGHEMLTTPVRNSAILAARRQPLLTARRSRVISNLRSSSASDAAVEGIAFFKSCSGAVAFAQGDLLPQEVEELMSDLKVIFLESSDDSVGSGFNGRSSLAAIPTISDLTYAPQWKPRYGSPCMLPGMILLSDACGRVSR
jgi:insulysin